MRGRGRKAEGYSCRMLDILYTIDYPIYVLWDGLIMTFFIKHVKACSVQCVLRLANEVIEPAGSVSLSFFSYIILLTIPYHHYFKLVPQHSF